MRETADLLDKVRDTIVATYKQKTSLSDEQIIEMMDSETWMSAEEAKEHGFIDEVLETANIAASTKNAIEMSSQRLKNIPESFKNAVKSANEQPKEAVKPMDLAKFKAEHSAIAEQFKAEISANHKTDIDNAVKAERQRIADIQDAALQGQDDLVKEAIENGLSAGDFAIKAMKQTKEKGAEFLAKRDTDAAKLTTVTATTTDAEPNQPQTEEDKLIAALDEQLKEVK
jgi:enoyl-CoA hydratase/carnithine racemase